jgi:hypothetical protein
MQLVNYLLSKERLGISVEDELQFMKLPIVNSLCNNK